MAKAYDVVIEAVRYTEAGKIDMVRAFTLRGFAYSDWVLLRREALLDLLKKGKRVAVGTRREFHAGQFEIAREVKLAGEAIVTGSASERDLLDATPIF